MLRPRRFKHEYDPGPVLIQARKVHFDVSDIPLHWIPGHPVASNFASLLNIVLRRSSAGSWPFSMRHCRLSKTAVRRIPDRGGGSAEMHDVLSVGGQVATNGPRNAFPLTVPGYGSPTQRLRFVAVGVGITPILPTMRHVDRLGRRGVVDDLFRPQP